MADRRILTIAPTSATVVSNMIGTGVFTTTGLMISMGAGAGDIVLAWFLGGVIAICGALCYAELGANMPRSGGEYFYLSRLLHPSLGYMCGWVSIIVGFAAPVAAAAMALNLYLGTVIPAWPVRLMAALTIIAVALLHSHDLRLGTRVQSAVTMVKVVLMIVFTSSIFHAASSNAAANSFRLNPDFLFSSPFAVVLIFVSFAYSGWNAAAYIGAELRHPERTLPWATLMGAGMVAVMYVLLNLSFLLAVPNAQLSGVEEVGNVVATSLWGATMGNLVSLLIAVTLVTPISAMLLVGPRVAEAMAMDGLLPGLFAKLNVRNVPTNAVAFMAAIAVVVALTSSFGPLLIYVGFTLNIFAALSVVSLLRLRWTGRSQHKLCWGYPLTPAVFLAFTIWMTVWSIRSQPMATVAGLMTLGLGYLIYLLQGRRGKKPRIAAAEPVRK